MYGGAGDDIYNVDSVIDIITEASSAGTDRLNAHADYALSSNVENLYLYGSAAKGTCNSFDNIICGNGNTNVHSSGTGEDKLYRQPQRQSRQ